MTETDLTEPLWRALAVYRFASLVYAVALVAYVGFRLAERRPATAP